MEIPEDKFKTVLKLLPALISPHFSLQLSGASTFLGRTASSDLYHVQYMNGLSDVMSVSGDSPSYWQSGIALALEFFLFENPPSSKLGLMLAYLCAHKRGLLGCHIDPVLTGFQTFGTLEVCVPLDFSSYVPAAEELKQMESLFKLQPTVANFSNDQGLFRVDHSCKIITLRDRTRWFEPDKVIRLVSIWQSLGYVVKL